jgi:hypothetical protein
MPPVSAADWKSNFKLNEEKNFLWTHFCLKIESKHGKEGAAVGM